uniref:Xaa-Pro aminopeptidase 2-like n=1 Tax=Hirondellea gigas TaxID=1518452 RepID=A0A6A7FSY8_9CRUS
MKETMAGVPTLLEFLKDNLSSGDVVAADPSLLGYGNWNGLAKGLSESGISLVASSTNLVDTVWDADSDNPRPAYGKDSAYPHSIEYAGLTIEEKLSNVRAVMASGGAQALVISTLDETAWLYNVRGNDIVYNPVVRSYAIVQEDNATWYLDLDKITPEIEDHLGDLVTIAAYDEIWDDLADLSSNPLINTIMLPDDSLSSGCSFKLYDTVLESKRWMVVTPTLKMKAQKNSVEISRMKEALIMDGVALSDFLAELERQMGAGEVPTEVTAQELLKTYRLSQKDCTELSFATISGYAEHGAIMHYEATNLTSVPIETDSLYLLDSGGQYLGGTTDITRTMHYGTPTAEMIEMYTLVLMGMIDFITLTFPSSMSRWDMEVLPRRPLYAKGLNYRHSSSHGIGMYLFVHEVVEVQVKPGYVLSNEPGFYKDGAWGVRIENQMLVVDTGMFFDEPFYTFEALSLVPYEPKLIDVALLTHYQANWLNAYNLEVREKVGQELLNQGRLEGYEWLLTKTEPIGISSATVPNPTLLPVIAVTLFTLIKGLYFTN